MTEKIIVLVLLISGLGALIWSVSSFVGRDKISDQGISPERYAQALKSQLPDKCQTPPGYTDDQWREHMGHHPDQYRECLGGAAQ